jgi:acetyl esterase/lipase
VALRATDPRHRPKLAALIYPAVEHDLSRYESTQLFDAPLNREIVHRDIRRYAPREDDHRDPRLAAMTAPDLSEMPPTYIATAGMDILRDQGEAFGERLLEVWGRGRRAAVLEPAPRLLRLLRRPQGSDRHRRDRRRHREAHLSGGPKVSRR